MKQSDTIIFTNSVLLTWKENKKWTG